MPYFVNVSCANIYRQPTFHSEVDTQAVLWEQVGVKQHKNDFTEVICEDGYSGWINRRQVVEAPLPDAGSLKTVTRPVSFIYARPDNSAVVVRDVAAGGYVLVTQEEGRWVHVLLPDGVKGWLDNEAIRPVPPLTRRSFMEYAKTFTGIPYVWGGKTGKGLDCSGYVQMVHKIFGIKLRRDAWMQFEDAKAVSSDPVQGQLGDLLFFAESGNRITHVGFALGNGKILHARGLVCLNSLKEGEADFDASLLDDFVAIGSYLNFE